MNSYELSRQWFDFCFENPHKVNTNHSAIFFFAVEHCNRLGWKETFGFPSQMVMEALGIKNWRTYSKALGELVDFGAIIMVERSKNQYSANIIRLGSGYVKNTKASTKALDKAFTKHSQKQVSSSYQSIDSIIKQLNKEQLNQKQVTKLKAVLDKYDFKSESLILPWSGEFENFWNSWKEYKSKEHKFSYKSEISEQSALKKLTDLSGGDMQTAIKIIERSIANGWKGFFKLDEPKQPQSFQNELEQRVETMKQTQALLNFDENGNLIY